jgi:hypothetical protein
MKSGNGRKLNFLLDIPETGYYDFSMEIMITGKSQEIDLLEVLKVKD